MYLHLVYIYIRPPHPSSEILRDNLCPQMFREWCGKNEVKISGVIVDEYGDRRGQYFPGTAVGFISALEKAKVAYASRAIWTEPGTLCGATTQDGKSPTSVWWVYKAYSDATGLIYDVAGPRDIMAIAVSEKMRSSAVILIGNQSDAKRAVKLVVRNLSKAGLSMEKIQVRKRHIPNSGSEALEEPRILPATFSKTDKETLTIDVGSLSGYEALEVILSD